MKRKLIWLKWLDSAFLGADFRSPETLNDAGEPYMLESAGFLVKQTDAGYFLAGDIDPEDGKYRYLSFVPKDMVKKKRVISIDV